MATKRRKMRANPTGVTVLFPIMYRGARSGEPGKLKGPSYFISSKQFAESYGPTATFEVRMKNPLYVSQSEWQESYSSSSFTQTAAQIAAGLKKRGYDGAVAEFAGAKGAIIVAFVVSAKQATWLPFA